MRCARFVSFTTACVIYRTFEYSRRFPARFDRTQHFRGYLDEVRVWDYARPDRFIASGMRSVLPGPGLLLHYPFTYGNGLDTSGNGQHMISSKVKAVSGPSIATGTGFAAPPTATLAVASGAAGLHGLCVGVAGSDSPGAARGSPAGLVDCSSPSALRLSYDPSTSSLDTTMGLCLGLTTALRVVKPCGELIAAGHAYGYQYGNDVCAGSTVGPDGACSGMLSYSAAEAFCLAAGARLPTQVHGCAIWGACLGCAVLFGSVTIYRFASSFQ
jgi:hypothetical protein